MSRLYLLRHGRTAWNDQQRIQGRTDLPLSRRGVTEISATKPSGRWGSMQWYCSPLQRARQTASLLGADSVIEVPELAEASWGEFEGLTLQQIEREIERRGITPAKGLDLLPPGGESPRMVRRRLQGWLQGLQSGEETNRLGVTHKGIIRAALSLATGWEMQDSYPEPVDWRQPLGFDLHQDGSLTLDAINLPW